MMMPHPLDLFGEVPVTWDEVYLWCQMVAGVTGWRRDWYIQHWNVISKVAAAKKDGTYWQAVARPNSPHALVAAGMIF